MFDLFAVCFDSEPCHSFWWGACLWLYLLTLIVPWACAQDGVL